MADNVIERDDLAALGTALFALFRQLEPLKHLPRTGWVDREVAAPESVAAHSWRLAMMAWLVADAAGLDSAKAVRIALTHDLAEAITGDHTPFDTMAATPAERRALASHPPPSELWHGKELQAAKFEAERSALETMLSGAPDQAAHDIAEAWNDYAATASPEADLVHQLDKLEALLQGCEYAADGRLNDPETLNSFRLGIENIVSEPISQAVLAAVLQGFAHQATGT